ncbi:MAG: hypothetical protein RBS99_15065 [Rhodospirillales bacterium]|jgi:hypothetical protein|nr:hypothetical protein [Rhodospirillales bacterium]
MTEAITPLFDRELTVVNVGIDLFAEALEDQGVRVVRVSWRPPVTVAPDIANLLDKLGGL